MPIYLKKTNMTKFDLLIIDDDELFLMLNKREIIKSGFHPAPITFNNGPMGLNWLNENDGQGKNALIFLDINMPQMDAWGFLDALNKAEPQANIKIYIVTSSADPKDKIKAATYTNVLGLIEKPLNRAVLEQMSQEVALQGFMSNE